MQIVMTGSTGLLGRNLLFEILKQNLNELDKLQIFTLGRPQKACPIGNRIENIIESDGHFYLNLNGSAPDLQKCIIPISFDLTKEDLGLSAEELELLKKQKIDYFFHVAALTDFRSDSRTKEKLENINVKGTQRLLRLLEQLNIKQFIYIGSAYSCGNKIGKVDPSYTNLEEQFRNPYEKSKLEAELLVRTFCKEKKLRYKIFRPTTISGRLLENPLGSVSKFDVFYGWAAYFLRLKLKQGVPAEKLFTQPATIPIRIAANLKAGLNIIPADYAAKILYQVCIDEKLRPINYHLANPKDALHGEYIQWMLDFLKVKGCSFVAEVPKDLNEMEKFYYRTVGKILTPYIIGENMEFSVENLGEILNKVKCPRINENNFKTLMEFAKQKGFGIKA